jgi:hypothetical protein
MEQFGADETCQSSDNQRKYQTHNILLFKNYYYKDIHKYQISKKKTGSPKTKNLHIGINE